MEGPDSADYLLAWRDLLDELTYYELFGVEPGADTDAVRAAFHVFCDTFHPDRHVGLGSAHHQAAGTIFMRGTEAYAVLSDTALREQYDQHLAQDRSPRPPRITFSPLSRPPASRGSSRAPLEESVRSPSARPFARRAEELVGKGDLRQAKLQLVMANHMDPGNEALEAALKDIEGKLAPPK